MTSQALNNKLPRRCILLAAAASLAGLQTARAQDGWPSRPVKMVIPFPVGQATDIYGRLFAERLARSWGQGVVVENRAGGSSIIIIGMEAIKSRVLSRWRSSRPLVYAERFD